MKFIKACSAFFLISFLFVSCMDNAGDSDNSGSSGNNARALLYEEVANTVWFASDSRLDFLEYNKKLYLNYMPDGIKTTKWVQLTGNGTKVVSAKVIWSENIREIGQTSNVFIYIDEYNKVHFECDFFELTGMDKIEGVEPARFYKDNLPALKSDYLSNFAGEYTLSNGWELKIGAKLSISKDVSHYWFANVLATEYDEKTKTYDLLLAHTSQKGAAGSTSPGITGNEPFVTKQGLFWNHCTLAEISGGVWNVKWSSGWSDSPNAAMSSDLDNSYTFSGPTETKIHYAYNFYFGVPGKDSDGGWCCVERGEWIGGYKEDSDVAKTWTWAEIKSHIPSYTIPEDKTEDYWWYGLPNSFYVNKDSYVHELKSGSAELSLENYDIYLALKDKLPVGKELPTNGTFISSKDSGNPLLFEGSTLKYGSNSYIVKEIVQWSSSANNECWALLLDDGISTYCAAFYWYTHYKGELLDPDYIHWYPPKLYSGKLPASTNFGIMNSRIKDYKRQ